MQRETLSRCSTVQTMRAAQGSPRHFEGEGCGEKVDIIFLGESELLKSKNWKLV